MKRFFVFAVVIAVTLSVCGCRTAEKISDTQLPAAGLSAPAASASGEAEPVVLNVACEDNLDACKMLSWMYGQSSGGVGIDFKADDLNGGIEALKAGDVQAALFALNQDELSEYGGMKPALFFSDGIAIIVNESNTVESVSLEQLKGILTGEITDWAQVGGAAGSITVYEGASPYILKAIEDGLGIKLGNMSRDYAAGSGDYGCAAVENEAGGISFTSLATALKKHANVLKLDSTAPSAETIASGAYPLKRDFYLMSSGEDEQTAAFLDYCINNTDVAAYLYDKGYAKP